MKKPNPSKTQQINSQNYLDEQEKYQNAKTLAKISMILGAIFTWKQKINKNSQRIIDERTQCGRETKAGAEKLKAQKEELRAGRRTAHYASERKRKCKKRKSKEAASSTQFQL